MNSRTSVKQTSTLTPSNTLQTVATILEINGNRFESKIFDPINVYDFMYRLRTEGKIEFLEKTYVGMGKFIISINGIENKGNQNWIYYVNDKKASIGISNYKINPGDTVSWKYEENI